MTPEPLAMEHPFGTGYLLGLVVVPLAVVFASMAGPLAGWAAFAALGLGAAALGPFTAARVAGVLAGVATVVALGVGAVIAVLSSTDF